MRRPLFMSNGSSPPPPQPPGGSMLMMLGIMVLMTLLIMNPDIRNTLGDTADPILSPILPEEAYFVFTVLILGSFSMTMNTVLRNFFTDPMAQAHIGHHQGQVRKMLNDARMSRDTILQEKATTLQQQMMPEQLKVQMGAMKPMMFTMIFIIAIFSWMATSTESFRVDYVSTPWSATWNFENKVFWIFPAWIATYISMSAPLGRIVDRHIKLVRYKSHPLVMAGESIPEPLLYLLEETRTNKNNSPRNQRTQRKRAGPRKTGNSSNSNNSRRSSGNLHVAPPKDGTTCKSCNSDMVYRTSSGKLRCEMCRYEWR